MELIAPQADRKCLNWTGIALRWRKPADEVPAQYVFGEERNDVCVLAGLSKYPPAEPGALEM